MCQRKTHRLTELGIDAKKILAVVTNPESQSEGYFDRKIAQSELNKKLVLRVVYEETDKSILVKTFYPANRRRYE